MEKVEKAMSETIDVPFEQKILSEPHLLELILDDATQIKVFRIQLTVIEGEDTIYDFGDANMMGLIQVSNDPEK